MGPSPPPPPPPPPPLLTRSSSVLQRPLPKAPSSPRHPSSRQALDPPLPPPRQHSLPLTLPTSPSKRPPLGSIHPRSANSSSNSNGPADERGKAQSERRRSVSASALAGMKGALEGMMQKKKSSSSLRAQVLLARGGEEEAAASRTEEREQAQRSRAASLVLPPVKTFMDESTDFSDSLVSYFDQLAGGTHLSPPPPSALLPDQVPPSPSSSSLYHSCASSVFASSTTSLTATAVASPSAPSSPAQHTFATLPRDLLPNKVDRTPLRSKSSLPQLHQRRPGTGSSSQGGRGEGQAGGSSGEKENEWYVSPPYVRNDWSPSSGDSPAFAIGENPLVVGGKKLVERGTLRSTVMSIWNRSEPGRGGKIKDDNERLTPLSQIHTSNTERYARRSPSSPTLRYSSKPASSPSTSSVGTKARTPSPLQFVVEPKSSPHHSTQSSLSSVYSEAFSLVQPSPSGQVDSDDGERTERGDGSTDSPTSLPASPLPDGLRYISSSLPVVKRTDLPLSPPSSGDALAQVASSGVGASAWERSGSESPERDSGWLFRRGDTRAPLSAENDGFGEDGDSEEEISFTSSSSFDAHASPSAKYVALNNSMVDTPPQSPASSRRGSDESLGHAVDRSSSEAETRALPPTRRSFARSPGAPSPSPMRISPTTTTPLTLSSLQNHNANLVRVPSTISTNHLRISSRPLPPLPGILPAPQPASIVSVPRLTPKSDSRSSRPRSMHEQLHRPLLASAPVTSSASSASGLFIPTPLTTIEGSPSSIATATPLGQRSTVVTAANGSPLASKQQKQNAGGPRLNEKDRGAWGDVTSEIEARIGYGKIQEAVRQFEEKGAEGKRDQREPTLRRMKKRDSLEAVEVEWPSMSGGAYLRKVDPSTVLVASPTEDQQPVPPSLKTRASTSSLRTPPPPLPTSNSFDSTDKPRTNSFTRLFHRRPSNNNTPAPSPTVDTFAEFDFDFEDVGLLEEDPFAATAMKSLSTKALE